MQPKCCFLTETYLTNLSKASLSPTIYSFTLYQLSQYEIIYVFHFYLTPLEEKFMIQEVHPFCSILSEISKTVPGPY